MAESVDIVLNKVKPTSDGKNKVQADEIGAMMQDWTQSKPEKEVVDKPNEIKEKVVEKKVEKKVEEKIIEEKIEEKVDDKESDDKKELDTIAHLRATIEELSTRMNKISDRQPKEEEEEKESKVPEDISMSFFKDDDFDDIITKPEKFRDVLKNLFVRVVEDSQRQANLIAANTASRVAKTQIDVERFYDDNKDLKNWRGVMGTMINKSYSEKPDQTLSQVLNSAADLTRKQMGSIKNVIEIDNAAKEENNESANPFLSRSTGVDPGRGEKSVNKNKTGKLTDQQKDIQKMLKADRK